MKTVLLPNLQTTFNFCQLSDYRPLQRGKPLFSLPGSNLASHTVRPADTSRLSPLIGNSPQSFLVLHDLDILEMQRPFVFQKVPQFEFV